MMRAGVLLALGVGYIAWPHVVWLAALALLVAAFGMPGWWRRTRPLTVQVDPAAHHFHYCAECDAQWQHGGESGTCVRHWAAPCPQCGPGGERDALRRSA